MWCFIVYQHTDYQSYMDYSKVILIVTHYGENITCSRFWKYVDNFTWKILECTMQFKPARSIGMRIACCMLKHMYVFVLKGVEFDGEPKIKPSKLSICSKWTTFSLSLCLVILMVLNVLFLSSQTIVDLIWFDFQFSLQMIFHSNWEHFFLLHLCSSTRIELIEIN